MKNKLFCMAVTASMIIPMAVNAEGRNIGVVVNGSQVDFSNYGNVLPVIEDDYTLIPIRAEVESLGAEVQWDEDSQNVTISGEKKVILKIGSSEAEVDGTVVNLDVPAKIIDDRTFVPIRFIAEAFNKNVEWNEESSIVEISDKAEDEKITLNFDPDNYIEKSFTVNGTEVSFRSYENIPYVTNPVDKTVQVINVYIPEEYFNGGSVNGYTADTAPIFFPNSVGGYMPSSPVVPSMEGAVSADASRLGLTGGSEGENPNAALYALSKGYVVAAPGSRGRTSQSDDGIYTGKAPAGIVDLKAAVRYLHYNDSAMPGNAEKIISNGTSAGGAMSALLGATGDSSDYEKYLTELGAADASDTVYAVSAYCPITNLENADMAYEWMFNGINDYTSMKITMENGKPNREKVNGEMNSTQIEWSNQLAKKFPEYVNGLNLKDESGNSLTLNNDGSGSFEEYLKSLIIDSTQSAIDSGENVSPLEWIKVSGGKVTDIDFDGYKKYIGRMKPTMAFDGADVQNAENNEFGTAQTDSLHFTKFAADADENNVGMADEQIIKMMNPMEYISSENTGMTKYWRIRHGVKDSDTAFPIPAILALKLENSGADVDIAIPWGQGHGGDYDLDELFAWTETVVKAQ